MVQYFSKKLNKKGFTLAELLIVVAIIAVLAAIAIPMFNSQLGKAKAGTDLANLRSGISVANTALLLDQTKNEAALATEANAALDTPTPQFGDAGVSFVFEITTQNGMKAVNTATSKFGGKTIDELTAAAK